MCKPARIQKLTHQKWSFADMQMKSVSYIDCIMRNLNWYFEFSYSAFSSTLLLGTAESAFGGEIESAVFVNIKGVVESLCRHLTELTWTVAYNSCLNLVYRGRMFLDENKSANICFTVDMSQLFYLLTNSLKDISSWSISSSYSSSATNHV